MNTISLPLKLTSLKTRTRKKIILSLVPVLLFVSLGVFTFKIKKIKKEKTARLSRPVQKSSGQTISLKDLPTVPAHQSEKTGLKDSTYQIRLVIRSKEDCWVQLKLDGKLVFQNILKKGLFESWQARQKIVFSLGNAGGIDLEVNGKIIPSLGRRGQVLKNILVTKEGLYIPQ